MSEEDNYAESLDEAQPNPSTPALPLPSALAGEVNVEQGSLQAVNPLRRFLLGGGAPSSASFSSYPLGRLAATSSSSFCP